MVGAKFSFFIFIFVFKIDLLKFQNLRFHKCQMAY